jgi:hypothetical protein
VRFLFVTLCSLLLCASGYGAFVYLVNPRGEVAPAYFPRVVLPPAMNQAAIISTPCLAGIQGVPIPPGNGHRGKEDGPSCYFPGLPLGLDMVPGISGAGTGLEARETRLRIRRS